MFSAYIGRDTDACLAHVSAVGLVSRAGGATVDDGKHNEQGYAGRVERSVVATVDTCRVRRQSGRAVDGASMMINRLSLTVASGRLNLARPCGTRAIRLVEGKSVVQDRHQRDLPSMHWGWIFERLTGVQALEGCPVYEIEIANKQGT